MFVNFIYYFIANTFFLKKLAHAYFKRRIFSKFFGGKIKTIEQKWPGKHFAEKNLQKERLKLNKKKLSSLVSSGSTLNSFRLFSRSFAEDAIIIQRRIVICNHYSLQFLG